MDVLEEARSNTTDQLYIFYYRGKYIDNGHIHRYVNIARNYDESVGFLRGTEVEGIPQVYKIKPGVLFNQYLGECCDNDCQM
jgi:hypothetical protein